MEYIFAIISCITYLFVIFLPIRMLIKRNKRKKEWQIIINENNNLGFKKRFIPLEYITKSKQNDKFFNYNNWSNGLWLNYQDKLIKFREGESKIYIEILFQDIYDVRMDSIGVSKTRGMGYGNNITLFGASTSDYLKSITIQIVVKDPNGGVKTIDLMLCNYKLGSVKRGTPEANAYEKCAAAILNEISYIIDNYT